MAIAPDVADKVVEVILQEVSWKQAINILEVLKTIDGGQSFNETIEMIYVRVRDSQGCGP